MKRTNVHADANSKKGIISISSSPVISPEKKNSDMNEKAASTRTISQFLLLFGRRSPETDVFLNGKNQHTPLLVQESSRR